MKIGYEVYAKLGLSALALLATSGGPVASAAEPPPTMSGPNIWSGVYSATQAKQGEALYEEHCAVCHMPDMGGREPAPAIAGDAFLGKWLGRSVGGLLRRISTTMPAGNPGSLTSQDYVDLMALLLQANDYPSGSIPLMSDMAVLDRIRISEKQNR
jgi:mono/diheme cytochrome c family protein